MNSMNIDEFRMEIWQVCTVVGRVYVDQYFFISMTNHNWYLLELHAAGAG